MCSKGLAKTILIAFNILFVILGAVCLGLGIWVYVDQDSVAGALTRIPMGDQTTSEAIDTPSLLENSSIGLMIGGGFMFFVGLMGCVGACKELRLFLIIYAVVVSLILILQIAAGILAIFFKEIVDEKLLSFLQDTLKDNYVKGLRLEGENLKLASEPIELGWDLSQFTFACCGAGNASDWYTAKQFDRTYTGTFGGQTFTIDDAKVPISCCKISNPDAYPSDIGNMKFVDMEGCLKSPKEDDTNLSGCYESIQSKMADYSRIMIILGLVVGILEIFGVIAACWLCKQIGKED